MNQELSKAQKTELNRSINIFWKEDENMHQNGNSWDLLMMTYERLCEVLPFLPFSIIGRKVYLEGEIDLPFKEAMFYAIGTCCQKYNSKEYSINYD